jgi:uncharacterized protein YegP (UPF0339 family)
MPVIPKTTRVVRVRIMQAKDGSYYFVLRGGNGEPVAVSETYKRRSDAIRGARRFMLIVSTAEIES